ncbi:MAG: hypothetical protein A2289_20085 [Deltaproteobacteria bacterium RIFOXYA12_FULL_58_15]|nr:MAG: hypothetical protein A2289_20085 [Deltaproteobacteria bacterium RIFOXYA12_FULL_58_15]OGR07150.1 MAG: hypothetical protein A2341_03380 [Deltaproteobacteria bacterium RIFOXYB12_FULL_58_9]
MLGRFHELGEISFMRILPFVLLCSMASPVAAQTPGVLASTDSNTNRKAQASVSSPSATSNKGTRGVHRVEAATAHPTGDIILVVGAQYSYNTGLFTADDTNENHAQHLTVVWAPIDHLELRLRQSTVSNRNDAFLPSTTQNLGDPTVGLKFSYPLMAELGIGADLAFMLPTSAKGTGLNAGAFVLEANAIVSYVPMPWLGVHLNAGYRLDNTKEIFKRDLLPVQRFTAGISQDNLILAGLGVDTSFLVGKEMTAGGFAEFHAGLAPEFDESPIRATVGGKWLPFGENAVDVVVGADFAVAGTPTKNATMAGIPAWEAFGQIAAHLNPPETLVAAVSGPAGCTTQAQCEQNQQCVDGYCHWVQKVIEEKEVIKEVPIPSFSIKGGVFNKASGDPLNYATLTFSGVPGSALAVDYKTATFESWPLPSGEGLVKVVASAPECTPSEQMVNKGKAGDVKEIVFKLQCGVAIGEIKGSLKDARTGKPVKNGQIFIPALKQKIKTDDDGKFSAEVKAGKHQILISGKKYGTQRKEIEIRAGDVVILNIDMDKGR